MLSETNGAVKVTDDVKIELSVVVPAFNEEERILNNALEISRAVSQFCETYEVVIVDDGSSDKTKEMIKKAAATDSHIRAAGYKENRGKGYALKRGVRVARGERIAFCDADLDLHPSQLQGFMKLMDETGAAAVIGSKMHKASKVDYPFIRRVYSYCYYLFLLVVFRLNTKDTQTGLKLFKAEIIKPVMRKILVKRFACDIEILSIIRRRKGKIVSAPIEIFFQRGTFGRIGFKDAWSIFIDTIAVYYRLNILKYYDD